MLTDSCKAMAARCVIAHLGVFRVLCHTLEIVHTGWPVANAMLRFVPVGQWKLEGSGRALKTGGIIEYPFALSRRSWPLCYIDYEQ